MAEGAALAGPSGAQRASVSTRLGAHGGRGRIGTAAPQPTEMGPTAGPPTPRGYVSVGGELFPVYSDTQFRSRLDLPASPAAEPVPPEPAPPTATLKRREAPPHRRAGVAARQLVIERWTLLDGVQTIKNAWAKTTQTLKRMQARKRVCLGRASTSPSGTGSPNRRGRRSSV